MKNGLRRYEFLGEVFARLVDELDEFFHELNVVVARHFQSPKSQTSFSAVPAAHGSSQG
jgi:hypothetical protein